MRFCGMLLKDVSAIYTSILIDRSEKSNVYLLLVVLSVPVSVLLAHHPDTRGKVCLFSPTGTGLGKASCQKKIDVQ